MNVKQFVDGYNSTTKNKTEYIKNHLKTKYVPYADKISACNKIIKISTEIDIEGTKTFKINTPMRKMFFMLSMIESYYDISIHWGEDVLQDFDLLNESQIIGLLLSNIPESELTLFSSVLEMVLSDYMENNRNLISYLETKFELVGMAINTMLDAFNNTEIQSKILELIK